MLGEAVMGLSALNTAFNMAKGLKDIDNAVSRNAAIIELQENILSAQRAQAALIKRIDDLEKEVAGFETWETEKKRYYLKDFGGSTFAYELKESEAGGEPIHRVCPACYKKRHISILQFDFRTHAGQDKYGCPECKTSFEFGHRQQR